MEILWAHAWTLVTGRRAALGGGAQGGLEAGARETHAARDPPPARPGSPRSRSPPPTSRSLAAGTRRSPQGSRTQRRVRPAGQNSGRALQDSPRKPPNLSDGGSGAGCPSASEPHTAHVAGRIQPAPPTSVCSALISPPPAGGGDWARLCLPGSGRARPGMGSGLEKEESRGRRAQDLKPCGVLFSFYCFTQRNFKPCGVLF